MDNAVASNFPILLSVDKLNYCIYFNNLVTNRNKVDIGFK